MYMIRGEMYANILNDSIKEMILDWMDLVPNVFGYKHAIVTLLPEKFSGVLKTSVHECGS